MIEPKEKAKELVMYFIPLVNYNGDIDTIAKVNLINNAKKCAYKVVNEIIAQWEYIDTFIGNYGGELNPNLRYWQQVKIEIENYGK